MFYVVFTVQGGRACCWMTPSWADFTLTSSHTSPAMALRPDATSPTCTPCSTGHVTSLTLIRRRTLRPESTWTPSGGRWVTNCSTWPLTWHSDWSVNGRTLNASTIRTLISAGRICGRKDSAATTNAICTTTSTAFAKSGRRPSKR